MADVRCLLAALRCEKGDIAGNLASHLRLMADAASAGCQLAVFPEMSLTGPADPASRPERLISLEHPAIARLAEASGQANVGVCFGVAERAPGGESYITQVFATAGRVAVTINRHRPSLGSDYPEGSIRTARERAKEAGVTDRVSFEVERNGVKVYYEVFGTGAPTPRRIAPKLRDRRVSSPGRHARH